MSYEDYAHHIYQKHRLAIAVAVLKTKPATLTSKQYIEQLKSKMADNMADNMDEDDITVCSDDFTMDYDDDDNDSITILKGFDNEITDVRVEDGVINDGMHVNEYNEQATSFQENVSQNTFYDSCGSQYIATQPHITCPTDNDITYYNNNQNMTHNINTANIVSKNLTNDNKVNNNSRILKDISSEVGNIIQNKDFNYNSATSNTVVLNKSLGDIASNKDPVYPTSDSNYDSQKTVIYSVHGFTQNNTHYSPSQSDMTVPNNLLYGPAIHKQINNNYNNTKELNNSGTKLLITEDVSKTKILTNTDSYDPNSKKYDNSEVIIDQTELTDNDVNRNEKATVLKDILENKEFEYSISKGHINNVFSQNHTIDNADCLKPCNVFEEIDKSKVYSQSLDDYFDEIKNLGNENLFSDLINIKTNSLRKTNTELSQNDTNIDENNLDPNQRHSQDKSIEIHDENIQNFSQNDTIEKSAQNLDANEVFTQQRQEQVEEYDMIGEENLDEVVPYKVLEELNKIKMFLRRRDRRTTSSDGYSTDSGYRSDSQIRSSNRSALQLSGISTNQSAYSLFNYLMECTLVAATKDIISDIAQSLGELIDKLHEEESYPSFLEELLDTIDILLRQVYKAHNNDDSEFLKKEEFIQRLLLLNNSIHIQKHTIGKITNILCVFHKNVTDELSSYELTNIDEIENISYIFHILELLIKKYIKNKTVSSQTDSQISQDEDKIFKRSSITDIWRKKWNPSSKIVEGSRENRCVLKDCSEILNKIVVECVTSYSLVAFAALKCFNTIQS